LRAKNHIISDRWSDFDGNYRAVIRTESLGPEDLIEARRTAYRQWHAHKASQFIYANLDLVGVLDGEWAYRGPYHAQIDLTDRCNNNCVACWCHSPLLGELKIRDPQTLSFEVVTGLLDELADMGTVEIYLAGGGEPFLHPRILDVVRHIKDRGMMCHINTNFTRVTKDTAQALIDMEVDHLIVSLWAASEETYARLHPNKPAETFHRMKDVLAFLINARTTRPYVKLYNVIFNQNYHEFDEMISLAVELNADTAEFTVVDTIPGKTDCLLLSEEERNFVLNRIGILKQRIVYDYEPHDGNYIFRFAEGKTLSLFKFEYFIRRLLNADYKIGEYDSDIVRHIPCYIGWNSTRILANGDVNVCLKAHKIPVGNIKHQRFRRIWNGEKQREFRRKALRIDKNDPLFSQIGNHPRSKIGCFKGCDDITRNVNCHQKLQSLLPHQRKILQQAPQRMGLKPETRSPGLEKVHLPR
jgi:MoaA/NifB/PqqE/SkfB family radical SAM enzyme